MFTCDEQLITEDSSIKMLRDKFADYENHFGRIERFVQETVDKLTFSMTIPKLLENDLESIKIHMKKGELEKLKVFEKYLPQETLWLRKHTTHQMALTSMSIKNIEMYFNSYSVKNENIPQRDEYDISNALNLLYNNENIRKISETHKKSISEAAFNFLQDMKLFLYSLLDKMKLNPQEAEIREAYLRKVGTFYNEKKDEALILEEKIIEQVKATETHLKLKLNEVTKLRENIDAIMTGFQSFIRKSSQDARKQMILEWKMSEFRQEKLNEKMKYEEIDLDVLRNKFVNEEKSLRTIRYKTEQHLILLLKQYDKDMQTRQNELDDRNNVVMMEMEQLREVFMYSNKQEHLYNVLMEEMEEQETRPRESKLRELRYHGTARKIQRYFKNFRKLLRIAAKKGILRNKRKRKKTTLIL